MLDVDEAATDISQAVAWANGLDDLTKDDVLTLRRATLRAIDATKHFLNGRLEGDLSQEFLPLKGTHHLRAHIDALQGTDEYKASVKISDASNAIQYMA